MKSAIVSLLILITTYCLFCLYKTYFCPSFMDSEATCLYVPVEGEIRVIPFNSTTLQQYLGQNREGICISNPAYRLSGFIRSFNFSDPVNKRCSNIYVAEIRGPVIIVDEHEDDDIEGAKSLSEKDIPKIFRRQSVTALLNISVWMARPFCIIPLTPLAEI